jgi:drug/metabolite transporter (DMT)-like permease
MPLAMQYEKSELASVLMISSVQLIVGFICIVVVLPFAETPRIVLSGQMIFALLYTTILATAVSIYVQAMYQKEISPTSAVLIYTLEPVAAVIIAYIFMNERFTVGEWAGAALIVGGMMLGQMRGKE